MKSDVLYEKDFYGWIYHNIDLLRQGKLSEINTELLIEELESMVGWAEQREAQHKHSTVGLHSL